jgi:hypothetical protein
VSADALRAVLATVGVRCSVTVDGTLAILTAESALPPLDRSCRTRIVEAARAAGFTHVALELVPDETVGDPTEVAQSVAPSGLSRGTDAPT